MKEECKLEVYSASGRLLGETTFESFEDALRASKSHLEDGHIVTITPNP